MYIINNTDIGMHPTSVLCYPHASYAERSKYSDQ